ncbi:geraniol 8-hydroxylase-like [Hordeum vulgare subsp. vulgare]|uniref:geraniol 8-hydroxylase-like n=1 Tax=Hordeum vulgare subsp. vulgare TaxID=112509 RepID=UPI000B46E856|nr:geraniol 8-hydroxylase-like [Hordeum vulgare subsp. vulgare]
MALLLVFMSSLLFMLLSSYALQLLTDVRRRLPPGPRPLPVIGNLLDVLLVGKLPHRSLARLAEQYGPLMTLRLGTVVVIVASSAATAREVLQTHNTALSGRNPPDAWNGMGHAANSVFVLPPRNKWRALRRIGAEHLLSPRRLDGDALRPLLRDAVLGMLRRVSELAASGAPVEVGHAAFASVMDLQWRAMFSVGLDEPTSRELHGFAREAVAHSLRPNVSDFFPALAAADLQRVRRGFATHLARVYQLIDQQIERRRDARQAGDGDARKDDLLGVMLDMSEEQGKDAVDALVNQDFMRAFFTDIFLAANDTISGTIEWAMAELLQDPQAMTKVQQELKNVLGSKMHVEYSDINQLPYLQAVIKETLRLHAVVPLVPNKAEATVKIHGHTVPKGSTVLVNVWAIHHDAELWPEPNKFIPERFLKQQEEVSFQGAVDLRFVPFSAGRRTCLGLPMATRMIHTMLGSLLHRFKWTLLREVEGSGVDMSEKVGITMAMASPLQAMARRI